MTQGPARLPAPDPALVAPRGSAPAGTWAECGHRSGHQPRAERHCPRPRGQLVAPLPTEALGPDSTATTSQGHRGLRFRTGHRAMAGWWHRALGSADRV